MSRPGQLGHGKYPVRQRHRPASPDQYTSARDSALLAKALMPKFPAYYAWYSEGNFTYNDIASTIAIACCWRDPSVDGLKNQAYRRGLAIAWHLWPAAMACD